MAHRFALVTGAARRLGREMALTLAREGCDVAVHYASSEEDAQELVAAIEGLGRRAIALKADLLNEEETQVLVERASTALGGSLDVLVNNASIFEYDNIETATRRSWDRHFESNLRAPFVLTQQFARQVPEPQADLNGEPVASGLIVQMVDQRVNKLTPEFTTYTLAKAGLWTLTQTAAQALAPRVRVNAIGPGPTMQGARQSRAHFTAQRAATILNRGANPEEIAAALRYFLSAKSVTGQLICVDGGQHLAWETPDIIGVE
ncbi:SDR family oxidoreductase [Qingshengfaniella alkalisoli]|uniref:SDR family oxidoreductase n=1 Tax=Qingshengfaniella alkalisoli TaxID=2599296 RepID=A0A5B8J5Z8_9RHOB|nr:SDR family oxidoreductase [Qingshengfaniella alkalisoli]QDY69760.1 SDR family oxidoreductase [Qingshengfaniella alkalisoli]